MGYMRYLLLLSLGLTLAHSIMVPDDCPKINDTTQQEFNTSTFSQENRTGSILRFCQFEAYRIRREHFWCLGYVESDGKEIDETTTVMLPEESESFWTIFLQYPALSWMDVGRKAIIMNRIQQIVLLGGSECSGVMDYQNFCVSNVETDDVSEYTEAVLITIYNLGLSAEVFNRCFNRGLGQASSDLVVEFRDQTAFRLSLDDMDLVDMFNRNIGPASSIGNEREDPTLRPVILGNWPRDVSLSTARDRVSDSDYATNPDPINYGLEPGDIVFSFFGSVLVFAALVLIALGFCIHPFFLA